MAVEEADAPEALPHQGAHDPTHQPMEGGEVDGDRAAELHVMLGQAGPYRRHDQHGMPAPSFSAARIAASVTSREIDHDGKMRPVLLGGAHRHDDDRILLGHC